ncbi:GntR family transcriptional regulator [Amycolatopsis pithecellobii]|uniref:GntR family transcriptional regulator n=1 Tax=Amycolatopsis pithecellobii TaxID=664692 RepID=UPI001408A980|nr:GntR family transcriptional regulator [Amycolatopsis pithecellobii]
MTVATERDDRALGVSEARARLRQAVLRTELRPGTVYAQDEVRKLLDVGRTPFREALRMVQMENLIDILPNGRLRIPPLVMDDVTHVQIARIALETAAARASVPKLGPEDFAHLEGFMAQMSHYLSSDHFDRVETPHLEFHHALLAKAGPTILMKIEELSDRVRRYRWAHSVELRSGWPNRTAEHRAILDAVIACDVEGAVAQLVRHYLESGLLLAEFMKESDPDSSPERFEEAILASLAPSVRTAVRKLR